MEWRNDILSFSGFDYGVSNNKNEHLESVVEIKNEFFDISDDEQTSQTSGDAERIKYLKTTYISSISDEVSTCNSFERTAIENSKLTSIEEIVEKQNKQENSKMNVDVLDERSVENLFFRNVEQAEKKMSTVVQLQNKWQRMTESGEMIDRNSLKPIFQRNPWKFDNQYEAMGKSDPLFKARGRGRPTSKSQKNSSVMKTGFEGTTQSPWRKTVSIFKQPVTQVTTSHKDTKVYLEDNPAMKKKPTKKNDTKPFQAMWAKSLSGLCAVVPVKMADKSEEIEKAEYLKETLHLAGRLQAATSEMDEQATVSTICHTLNLANNNGTFGQVAEKAPLEQCLMANLTSDQPMIQRINVTQLVEDIQTQEKRVLDCRRRLQEVMKHFG